MAKYIGLHVSPFIAIPRRSGLRTPVSDDYQQCDRLGKSLHQDCRSAVVAISGQELAEISLVLTFIGGDILGATALIGLVYIVMKTFDNG